MEEEWMLDCEVGGMDLPELISHRGGDTERG
jgi:hypothetical protein